MIEMLASAENKIFCVYIDGILKKTVKKILPTLKKETPCLLLADLYRLTIWYEKKYMI